VTYTTDPRVDTYIEALPEWQQAICRKVRDLVHAAAMLCTSYRALARQSAHGGPSHAKTRLNKRVLQHRYRDSNPGFRRERAAS
jgi:hypothetical protein